MVWTSAQLGYCSNVHQGETLSEVNHNLNSWIKKVREKRELSVMQSGLWLGCDAVSELFSETEARNQFLKRLDAAGLRLVTLNAFPFGGFHRKVVKESVYRPDWSTTERVHYTYQCAVLLASCLPADVASGTISTLPLGFASDWTHSMHQSAIDNLLGLVNDLDRLEQATGKHIRVCLEMEPGCVLERTEQLVRYFDEDLAQASKQSDSMERVNRYLGACVDICHQAVMFEDLGLSMQKIRDAGIVIGKIQVSSALSVAEPGRADSREALRLFAEEKYLHQVGTKDANGRLVIKTDLRDAMEDTGFPSLSPWRIHFHVPIHASRLYNQCLGTTRDDIEDVLQFLSAEPDLLPHLEVETYTWDLLPGDERPEDAAALVDGLARELQWLESGLARHGLLISNNRALS